MSKILVTGGAGFVGSALCKELFDLGHSIVSLDNYSNGFEWRHHDGVKYIKGDVKNITELVLPNFDYIFHLGEYARVEQSYGEFDTVIDYNLKSFPELLNFAKASNAKVIYSGSSTKFAVGENGRMQSPYAFTKAQNTELLKAYSEWYGLEHTIVYFYNVYGPGENGDGKYGTVVQKFLNMVKDGATTLPVTSPGTQMRNFTHVQDIVDGLIKAGFEGSGDGYCIGNPKKYTISQLVDLFGVDKEMMPAKPGNRMDGLLDLEKMLKLGWQPKHNLKDYIDNALANNI